MSRFRPSRSFALLLLVAMAGGAALLLAWIPRDRHRALDGWRARLSAIADDRRRTIEVWVGERQADVKALGALPGIVRLGEGKATDDATRTLEGVARAYGYLALWV